MICPLATFQGGETWKITRNRREELGAHRHTPFLVGITNSKTHDSQSSYTLADTSTTDERGSCFESFQGHLERRSPDSGYSPSSSVRFVIHCRRLTSRYSGKALHHACAHRQHEHRWTGTAHECGREAPTARLAAPEPPESTALCCISCSARPPIRGHGAADIDALCQ